MALIGPGFLRGGASGARGIASYLGGKQPTSDPSAPSTSSTSAWSTDPGYQAALAAQTQGDASATSQYNASVEQLLGQFGDSSFASWAGFNDPQAQAIAHQNYLSGNSTLARLDQAHGLARKGVLDTLAAHGILRSGDLGYRTHLADQSYNRSVYDAEQSLLGQIAGLQNNRLNAYQGYQQGVVSALQQAWQNYIAHPELYTDPTQAPSAPPPATRTAPPAAPSANGASAFGGNVAITPTNFYTDTSLSAQSRPRRRAVVQHLGNPYETGQKRYG